MDAKFDIFRRLPGGQPIWVKAIEGLDEAKRELQQVAERDAGEYFIFDPRNGRMISSERTNSFISFH